MAGGVLSGKQEATIKMMPFDNEVREECGNCRYWDWEYTYEFEGKKKGACVRYPRHYTKNEWDWCGDWKGKDDPDR